MTDEQDAELLQKKAMDELMKSEELKAAADSLKKLNADDILKKM